MKSYRHSIRHRRKKRYKRNLWRGCLAAVSMIAVLLGCIHYPGLENILAEETSGYRIDASYQRETNEVVLTGNTEGVKADVTLGVLKDQEGQEYTPDSFQKTVTENGTYTYELTYSSVNAQTGVTEEKTEELEVKVDQIQAPVMKASAKAAEEPASEAIQTQTEQDQTAEGEAADETDGNTIPVSELQAAYQAMSAQERATAAGSREVVQYAQERNTYEIGRITFSGGPLGEGEGPLFGETGTEADAIDKDGLKREFAGAGYILPNGDPATPNMIVALYPWYNATNNNYDWYYVAEGQQGWDNDYGNIQVGHLLPADADVRFYYRLATEEYTLTIAQDFNNKGFNYSVTGLAGGTYGQTVAGSGTYQVMQGDTITLSVQLPNTYLGAVVGLQGLPSGDTTYGLKRQSSDSIGTFNQEAELTNATDYWYDIEFTMPAATVTTSLQVTEWPTNTSRAFAVYLPDSQSSPYTTQNYEFGFTRLFTTHITTPSGTTNWSRQIGYSDNRNVASAGIYGRRLGLGNYTLDTAGYWKNDSGSVSNRNNSEDKATAGQSSQSSAANAGGGAPYTHSEWYGWREGSTSYTAGETLKQSSDNTKTGNYSLDLANAYADPWSTATTPMAKGQYYPGETVGFRLEMAKGRTGGQSGANASNLRYYYKPGNITLDVYAGDQTISDKNFERYTIALSDLKGVLSGGLNDDSNLQTSKTISVAGGTITIKCISYGTYTFDPMNPTGTQSQANQYGGSWNGGSHYNKYGHYDDRNNSNLLASAPIFAYYIEVDGLTRPFKISYSHASGAQQITTVNNMTGVEEGVYANNGITGSKITIKNGERPLTESYQWNNNEKVNGANNITIQPMEGYGEVKVELRDGSGNLLADSTGTTSSGSSGSGQNAIARQGTSGFVYNIRNSQASNTISQLNITANPLTFHTEYYYNNANYDPGSNVASPILSYDTSNAKVRSFRIPGNAIPEGVSRTSFLRGFQVQILGPYDTEWIPRLNTPEGEDTWQIGDEITVEYIYQKLLETRAVGDNINNYKLRLIPQMTEGTTGEYLSANYTVYNQMEYFDGQGHTDYAGLVSDDPDNYDVPFEFRVASVLVQKDVQIMLLGFEEAYTSQEGARSGRKFVLDTERSTVSTIVTALGQNVGNAYYAAGTQLWINIPTDLADQATITGPINTWNNQYGARYYAGNSMVTPFTQVMPVMPESITVDGEKRDFAGWKIVQGANNDQSGTTEEYESWIYSGYTLQQATTGDTTLNLNALGRDRDVQGSPTSDAAKAWDDAFGGVGQGLLKLIPYYVNSTKPITLTEDGQSTGEMGSTKVYANANGSHNHSLESTFYMEGEPIDTNTTVNYAIYAKEEGKENWGRTETGTINLSDGSVSNRQNTASSNNGIFYGHLENSSAVADITTTTSGNTSITLKISNITRNLGGTGTQYRVYMWNEANGEVTSAGSYDTGTQLDSSSLSLAARDWYSLTIIYPFTSREVTADTGFTENAYSAESGVTIQTGGIDGKATLTTTLYYWGKWDDYTGETLNLALYRTGYGSAGSASSTYSAEMWIKEAYKITGGEDTAAGSISITTTNSSNTRFMSQTVSIRATDNTAAGRGSVTITVELLNESRDGSTTNNRLRYAYEDATSPSQRVWKVYGWNLANANKEEGNITGGTLGTGGQSNLPAISGDAQVALVDHKIHIIPKAVASTNSSVMHVEEADPTRAKTGTDFLVTATFRLDPYYPSDLQLGTAPTGSDPADVADGKMHMAIMKLNPNGADTDWKTWMFDDTVTNSGKAGNAAQDSKVEKVSVIENKDTNEVTITYRLIDVEGSITREYENGAQYEILAWNSTNTPELDNSALTQNELDTHFSHPSGTSYGTVPSVIHTVSMVAPEIEAMQGAEASATVDTHTREGFDITAKFRYMTEGDLTWDEMKSTVEFALYREAREGTVTTSNLWGTLTYSSGDTWSVTKSGSAGDKLNATATATKVEESGGYVTISLTLRINNKTGKQPSVQYAWEDADSAAATKYYVYAWSEGNTYNEDTGGFDDVTLPETGKPSDVPSFTGTVNVLPDKVRSSVSGGGSGNADLGDGIYHWSIPEASTPDADGSISLSAAFETDQYWYPDTVGVASVDKTDSTTLRAALYIQFAGTTNADGTGADWGAWTLVADQEGVRGTDDPLAGKLQIGSANGPTTTVSWTLNADYVKGRPFRYCVALWNDTNTDTTVSADNFKPDDTATANIYNQIPSVTQEIRPQWQNPSYYVYVPKEIILTEDGAKGTEDDGNTWVGNSGTIRYVTENEWNTAYGSFPQAFPEVTICTAKQLSIQNSDHSKTIKVGVYKEDGTELEADVHQKPDHGTIGTLVEGVTPTLTYQLNAQLPKGIQKGEKFSGTMTYHFNSATHGESGTGGAGQ